MGKSIKQKVNYIVHKFGTKDPFRLAKYMNVIVQHGNLGEYGGCYMFLKNHRYIFLNNNLGDDEKVLIMANELGHAILHSRTNCYFIRNKTYFLCSRIENEANRFAVNLIISDDDLHEYTISQISMKYGIPEKLVDLRTK